MATSREIFDAKKHLFRNVPSHVQPNVCPMCLGPVGDYKYCYECQKFQKQGCSRKLVTRVVPMTIALNPSPWYAALLTYKRGQLREHGTTLGTLAHRWLTAHAGRLEDLLDGEPDYVTIVPSKSGKWTYDTQPLRLALAKVTPLGARLTEVLRLNHAMTTRLREYDPSVFETVVDVEGARVILIEDTWISGATALSAAGTLLEAGAKSVVVTPIAREMRPDFHGKDHPYLQHLEGKYNIDKWPR